LKTSSKEDDEIQVEQLGCDVSKRVILLGASGFIEPTEGQYLTMTNRTENDPVPSPMHPRPPEIVIPTVNDRDTDDDADAPRQSYLR